MEISYILLIITCFFYGATQIIGAWEDFESKLINVLVILAIIVLAIITGEDGFLNYYRSDWYWLNYLFPAGAVILGYQLGDAIDDDDWPVIFLVLAGLGLIATIITTCCGI